MNQTIPSGLKKVNEYYLTKAIGKGSFGTVYLATTEKSDKKYAVKQISKSLIEENLLQIESLKDEVFILKSLKHENIVTFVDCLITTNNYYLITELCNQGSLKTYLAKTYPSKFIPENEAKKIMIQIRDGFRLMRAKKLIHNDFKIENVFVNQSVIKIGDFGTAVYKNVREGKTVGSLSIMAPELMFEDMFNGTTDRTDLWSIGCVFYYILYQNHPFPIDNEMVLRKSLRCDDFTIAFPGHVSEELKDLIKRLLNRNPNCRISWNDFFDHPVWQDVVNPSIPPEQPRTQPVEPQSDSKSIQQTGNVQTLSGQSQNLQLKSKFIPKITDPSMEFTNVIDDEFG